MVGLVEETLPDGELGSYIHDFARVREQGGQPQACVACGVTTPYSERPFRGRGPTAQVLRVVDGGMKIGASSVSTAGRAAAAEDDLRAR